MKRYTFFFHEIDETKLNVVGGKAANLARLSTIADVHVPKGFCLSTEAFREMLRDTPTLRKCIEQLSHLKIDDPQSIRAMSSAIRSVIENAPIPEEVDSGISSILAAFNEADSFAIRSSATAEDLPSASFAGQYDTFLNVIGQPAILDHIKKCWASLFSERAITYRLQNGVDHSSVCLAVIVQKMVFPKVSGIMFTADPVTCNRKVVSIDASFGLGEALVSGIVNADNYRIRDGVIVEKKISVKEVAAAALEGGGTGIQQVQAQQRHSQALSDQQLLLLEQSGRKIEAHFGAPQDIEWCFAHDGLFILQSRPVTTLYPIPGPTDERNRVFLSVGHHQMMTDAMKPLGLSIWQMIAAGPRMLSAGSRLFVDITQMLSSSASRANLLASMEQYDLLVTDALKTIIERNFIECPPDQQLRQDQAVITSADVQKSDAPDPATAAELIEKSRRSLDALKNNIRTKSGADLFDFIAGDIVEMRKSISDPKSMGLIMAAINASTWINQKMNEWLQEQNVADILSQSVPDNVTSEMGLKLLDVADAIRPLPQVIAYLKHVEDETFPDGLSNLEGGKIALEAIRNFLDQYGMRCPGEIDITRPRWAEKPTTLIPVILSNISNLPPGESKRRFEQGRIAALEKERDIIDRLQRIPEGGVKASEAKQKIATIRNLIGYREYPKYAIISRLFIYKNALMEEAKRLHENGIISEKENIDYLTFEEFRDAVKEGRKLDCEIINARKEEYRLHQRLNPPRIITSDGEIITGRYKKENLPLNAIVGLAVSSGVVEGRARVVLRMEEAQLEEGDILITPFTDPSWTPLFLSVKGLITEVGGLMTHGAVVAREYGLPAVVGVEYATKIIQDRQRIRLNGTEGFIEILK